jgi:hypothetical protein
MAIRIPGITEDRIRVTTGEAVITRAAAVTTRVEVVIIKVAVEVISKVEAGVILPARAAASTAGRKVVPSSGVLPKLGNVRV